MSKRRLSFMGIFGDITLLAGVVVVGYALIVSMIFGGLLQGIIGKPAPVAVTLACGIGVTILAFGSVIVWLKWDERHRERLHRDAS